MLLNGESWSMVVFFGWIGIDLAAAEPHAKAKKRKNFRSLWGYPTFQQFQQLFSQYNFFSKDNLFSQDYFFSRENFFSQDNLFSWDNFFSIDNFFSLAFSNCLGLAFWYHQLELRWYLHQLETNQLSQQTSSEWVSEWVTLGPIDRSPVILGSDKNKNSGCHGFCLKARSLRRHSMLDVSHKHLCFCLIKIEIKTKLWQKPKAFFEQGRMRSIQEN